MNDVVIALGSNIEPEKNIEAAIKTLDKQFRLISKSQFVKTAPVGYTEQDDFLNGAVHLNTERSLQDMKYQLLEIEENFGRKRVPNKFGPRTIDLDIIIWNNHVLDDDFYNREFIRNSVLEIKPELG